MGLDEIVKEESYQVGSVTSDIDADNVDMDRDWWQHLAGHNPEYLSWNLHSMDEDQKLFFIELLDNATEGDVPGIVLSEDEIQEAKRQRQEITDSL